jgi:hypothetical protein
MSQMGFLRPGQVGAGSSSTLPDSNDSLGGTGSAGVAAPTTLLSGQVPTPWRHVVMEDGSPLRAPSWLPHYWWTHHDFSADVFHIYDLSYDENLLKMLPKWMKAIMVSLSAVVL